MRARSCPGEGSQWHGRKCSCQDIDIWGVFKTSAPMLTAVQGLNSEFAAVLLCSCCRGWLVHQHLHFVRVGSCFGRPINCGFVHLER